MQQRESMSVTDYRQSLQYISNFYQKHQITSDEKLLEDDNPFSSPDHAGEPD